MDTAGPIPFSSGARRGATKAERAFQRASKKSAKIAVSGMRRIARQEEIQRVRETLPPGRLPRVNYHVGQAADFTTSLLAVASGFMALLRISDELQARRRARHKASKPQDDSDV